MHEVVYSSEPQLLEPRTLLRVLRGELRAVPSVAWQLFTRRMQAAYRQSLLGYIWLILPPIATTAVWVVLNNARILQVGETSLPYPVFVLTGTLLWQLFVDALNAPLAQLNASRSILKKSRIPHEAVLVAGVIEVLFNFLVRLIVLVPVFAWLSGRWSAAMLLAPLGVLALLVFGFALGLLLSPLGMLYADVSRGITLVTGMLFFLSPVLYPIPDHGPASLLRVFNPVTPLLTTAREWLTGGVMAPSHGFVAVFSASVVMLVLAWGCYRVARPHIIARL